MRLRIGDQWNASRIAQTSGSNFHLSRVEDNFLVPIYHSFTRILSASFNLTSVAFTNMTIGLDVIRCISQLRSLHTLDLVMCAIPSQAAEALLVENAPKKLSCAVSNLYLSLEDPSAWYCLLFFPYLCTLSTRTLSSHEVLPPPDDVWQNCSFFSTLEHLCLDGPDDISVFAELAAATSLLKLTHFKLRTDRAST
jgi:hypothetical protein